MGYARLVRRLIDLSNAYDPRAGLDAAMFLSDDDAAALRDGRLLSLIRKMQMSRCGELIASKLVERLPGPLPAVGAGLTNTQGLVEWFVEAPNGRSFGWQAQGSQFRLVAITSKRDPKSRPRREELVEEHHVDFFDFSLPDELRGLLAAYAGSKSWLGYEPDFVYRYETLALTSPGPSSLDWLFGFLRRRTLTPTVGGANARWRHDGCVTDDLEIKPPGDTKGSTNNQTGTLTSLPPS